MENQKVSIIAGPCSVDESNIDELYEISSIAHTKAGKKSKAIAGVRVVGIKSRTELDKKGNGMGIDFEIYQRNTNYLLSGGSISNLEVPPSVIISESIHKKTGMRIATEIMSPFVQLPVYENRLSEKAFMPWNPAVEQLGWHMEIMGHYVNKNNWNIGIKNGKWLGDTMQANEPDYQNQTTMEKTWLGLKSYAKTSDEQTVFIHRGVDIPEKGDYRNAPVHYLASRVKEASKSLVFFDPSHTHGPKMRNEIVDSTVYAMNIKISDNAYLYDGILIEVGTSKTDTEQHITIKELQEIVDRVGESRDFVKPLEM